MYPVQHPAGTPKTNNTNLLQHQVKVPKNLMLVRNSDRPSDNHRDPQQADNDSNSHNAPHRAYQIIVIIIFLTGIIDTVISQDKHDSMRSRIKCIPPITLPLPPHSLQALTYLVILLCSLQKHSLILLRFLQHNKSLNLMYIKS